MNNLCIWNASVSLVGSGGGGGWARVSPVGSMGGRGGAIARVSPVGVD
jgi:hypothetical protein